MRKLAPNWLMFHAQKILLRWLLVPLLLAPSFQAKAAPSTLAFKIAFETQAGSDLRDEPIIRVTNESRTNITYFEMTVGDTGNNLDTPANVTVAGVANAYHLAKKGGDELVLDEITGWAPGTVLVFYLDIDSGDDDYRTTLFNNGTKPNSVITVMTADGQTESLTLPDGPSVLANYTFFSELRPRTLIVESVAEAGGTNHVKKVKVRINGTPWLDLDGLEEIGESRTIGVYDGDAIEIIAPKEVYKDIDGVDITDSVVNDPQEIREVAEERFTAIGISVNNVPQTGDPTLFQFDVSDDTDVVVKWGHHYALTIESDYLLTESTERLGTNAWAGPLTSEAAGNPNPTAKKHWIKKDETVIALIDGQVIDFSHPGLDIRYVPKAYAAIGPPNRGTVGWVTNQFSVGQSPAQLQQVPQFTMNGAAKISYIWQIQFGVRVNIDDVSRAALPRVFEVVNGAEVEVGLGEGVFWFTPGTPVKVSTPANASGEDSQAVKGWVSGDGFYFSSSGDIDTTDGSLSQGGPEIRNGSPVAAWQNEFVVGGRTYRGLDIPQLNRPARVFWRYGTQAIAVQVTIGEYVFQNDPAQRADIFTTQPDEIKQVSVSGRNRTVGDGDMAVWDPVPAKLYPLVPGQFRAKWRRDPSSSNSVDILVTAIPPSPAHYPHIADTPPVALDRDPDDSFIFKELKYVEADGVVDGENMFTAEEPGLSVLLFSEIQRIGRGEPREYLRVRVVDTKRWDEALPPNGTAIIGQRITDSLDRANLETGHIMFEGARYNPLIYDATKLDGLAVNDVYDLEALRSNNREKVVIQKENLPGPIIPVNLHPGAPSSERVVVVWYDDPTENDELLWPHRARVYIPRWPENASEGLGRIVIASQFGSESQVTNENNLIVDQEVLPAIGDTPQVTTYNPSRVQQVQIYSQDDENEAGYNPNEEHALMAPSLRFADVSPRPPAAYALRDNDLNRWDEQFPAEVGQPTDYTSHPYVLVQLFDTADNEFKMRVYEVVKEFPRIPGYEFADLSSLNPRDLLDQPHVVMEAGEPVIPFYPLVEVIGASPSPETFGTNLFNQAVYWEDHKGSSWSVSGGENAWFTHFVHYPLTPDFWWPDEPGFIVVEEGSQGEKLKTAAVPRTGDSVSFLPADISQFLDLTEHAIVTDEVKLANQPTPILFKSDWPENAPVLKAGETLTFSGGEFRTDNPLRPVVDDDGEIRFVETPGLPGIVAFATAELVFDSLNPMAETAKWNSQWTARVGQVLNQRSVPLSLADFPSDLQPATQRTRVKQGKYIFNDLPASLQKRVLYDPLGGKLLMIGLLNDKEIGDRTLTAAPPAVYVLEPNIITAEEEARLLKLSAEPEWTDAVVQLAKLSRNPSLINSFNPDLPDENDLDYQSRLEQFWEDYYRLVSGLSLTAPVPPPIAIGAADTGYLVGLEPKVLRDDDTGETITIEDPAIEGLQRVVRDPKQAAPVRAFGPGLALLPNAAFLDPNQGLPDISWVTVVENNDPSLGGSPITLHVIQVDRRERYRGAIKTITSDNVFDENLVLRHQGDFGANADELVFEWWYRPDDGSLNVPPPDLLSPSQPNPWKLFPDPSGNRGQGRFQITLKGNPNAPEALLADTWWFARYRHSNDRVENTDWDVSQLDGSDRVNFTWAGAGNSDPFNDFDNDGILDYRAQLAQGWIKRVLDAVNPYEARIRDFDGDNPSTRSSMIAQFGPRFEGPVALNPAKNVIENVGLIELYETILKRGRDLSINLSRPVSTPAIANALQLAATRISDFYTILGNEGYVDALDPTIGFGSDSVDYGSLAPAVFSFQNQMSSLIEEELALLRGVDDFFARPVYNRLFWNFTKGEGEAAYALSYNISDINTDGFIDEDDAMILYPQGHGDAWGHYLTAVRNQYDLLQHRFFNWVSRSEFYNLQDIVIKVDFLDERKFAQTAASKAKVGAEIVNLTYRDKYVEDPTAQWQGYTDPNTDKSWGVQGWARRAAQGTYFDWVTANALLPSEHPNETLEGIQKVDRSANSDIAVISANLNAIQNTFDQANKGRNPLGLARGAVVFDIDPNFLEVGSGIQAELHFDQIYSRAVQALDNAVAIWDNANESRNMLRQVANSEAEFQNDVFQEDLAYRNDLIRIFGKPYEGTIGPGRLYPAGYDGPDLLLFMYVDVRQINDNTVPGPTTSFAAFDDDGTLSGGQILDAFAVGTGGGFGALPTGAFPISLTLPGFLGVNVINNDVRQLFAPSFAFETGNVLGFGFGLGVGSYSSLPFGSRDGLYAVNYTHLFDPKVPLDNLTELMPVTAAGYTFQAPRDWGSRGAVGELQQLINQMLQQEAGVAGAIGAYDGLQGDIIRTLRLVNARIFTGTALQTKDEIFSRVQFLIQNNLQAIQGVIDILESTEETIEASFDVAEESIPKVLPTGGVAVSPGDALSAARGGAKLSGFAATAGISTVSAVFQTLNLVAEYYLTAVENELDLFQGREELALSTKEWLKELEDLVGDEPVARIEIFKELQALRELSDQYRALVDEGGRLVDERVAFNKRVAAQTQRNRYQDMTFRVSRNHALQTYRKAFDLAAKYAYLAGTAYDYETNLDPTDIGSPRAVLADIVRARSVGLFDGDPRTGGGGLAESLAWLKANYEVLRGQLGINNPAIETGKISLRTELFRILPQGTNQPPASTNETQFPSPGASSDALWLQTLLDAQVEDLWLVPEFRHYCRPFASDVDAEGNHVKQPGLVFRFGTEIIAGRNFFGKPLSGADHSYDPTRYSTKIRAAGIWFSDYRSGEILSELPDAPYVYLVPTGIDIMSIPSESPNLVRFWNVVDQRIPVPLPASGADLDSGHWIPLLDSLSGRLGDPRKFSSFRAYHDGDDEVDGEELVYDTRLVGRSVWNTEWILIIPGITLNSDPKEGLKRFRKQVTDIKLVFESYSFSGG